jgi:hypothetical protein
MSLCRGKLKKSQSEGQLVPGIELGTAQVLSKTHNYYTTTIAVRCIPPDQRFLESVERTRSDNYVPGMLAYMSHRVPSEQ